MNTKCCGRFVCLESEAIVQFYTNVVICGIFQKLEMLGSTAALECLFDYQNGNVTATLVLNMLQPRYSSCNPRLQGEEHILRNNLSHYKCSRGDSIVKWTKSNRQREES